MRQYVTQTRYYGNGRAVRNVREINHGFHIMMSIVTGGMWFLFVYWPILATERSKRKKWDRQYIDSVAAACQCDCNCH